MNSLGSEFLGTSLKRALDGLNRDTEVDCTIV